MVFLKYYVSFSSSLYVLFSHDWSTVSAHPKDALSTCFKHISQWCGVYYVPLWGHILCLVSSKYNSKWLHLSSRLLFIFGLKLAMTLWFVRSTSDVVLSETGKAGAVFRTSVCSSWFVLLVSRYHFSTCSISKYWGTNTGRHAVSPHTFTDKLTHRYW